MSSELNFAIKGFDKDLSCRGYKFEIGQTYKHDGLVKACKGGFHCITAHPLAVFDYYPPAGSRFCRVTISGTLDSDDSIKTAAEILTVASEIGFAELTQEAVDWAMARAKPESETATGDQGAASATGDQGAASATGTRGAASATGTRGAASATGYQGAALACGYEGRVRGANGNALFAIERSENYDILSIASGIVGRDGIKPNTWYLARSGHLVEVAS